MKTKIKADAKETVVMCCQIVDWKTVAPSSGDFWDAIGAAVSLWAKSGILKKKTVGKKINTPVPQPRPDFRRGVPQGIFNIS